MNCFIHFQRGTSLQELPHDHERSLSSPLENSLLVSKSIASAKLGAVRAGDIDVVAASPPSRAEAVRILLAVDAFLVAFLVLHYRELGPSLAAAVLSTEKRSMYSASGGLGEKYWVRGHCDAGKPLSGSAGGHQRSRPQKTAVAGVGSTRHEPCHLEYSR
ncbi:hypothetical protein HPB50_009111 [Hyalomma asiaticum]|uniref:Uncharacterized protein n=1 Tax=Hyalomma asiaticum TaxID=266040 RepID=A0ACB7T3J6_HYAAI|nr:hypothetical protein HPB50_009111 [Hyalomma asiaticum]